MHSRIDEGGTGNLTLPSRHAPLVVTYVFGRYRSSAPKTSFKTKMAAEPEAKVNIGDSVTDDGAGGK